MFKPRAKAKAHGGGGHANVTLAYSVFPMIGLVSPSVSSGRARGGTDDAFGVQVESSGITAKMAHRHPSTRARIRTSLRKSGG